MFDGFVYNMIQVMGYAYSKNLFSFGNVAVSTS
jgi:hypothetical protein